MVASGRLVRLDAEPERRLGEAVQGHCLAAFLHDVFRRGGIQEYGFAPEFVSAPGPFGPAGVQDGDDAVIELHTGPDDRVRGDAFPSLQVGQGHYHAFADGVLQGDLFHRPAAGLQEMAGGVDMGADMGKDLQPGQHVRGELEVVVQFDVAALQVCFLHFSHAGQHHAASGILFILAQVRDALHVAIDWQCQVDDGHGVLRS